MRFAYWAICGTGGAAGASRPNKPLTTLLSRNTYTRPCPALSSPTRRLGEKRGCHGVFDLRIASAVIGPPRPKGLYPLYAFLPQPPSTASPEKRVPFLLSSTHVRVDPSPTGDGLCCVRSSAQCRRRETPCRTRPPSPPAKRLPVICGCGPCLKECVLISSHSLTARTRDRAARCFALHLGGLFCSGSAQCWGRAGWWLGRCINPRHFRR